MIAFLVTPADVEFLTMTMTEHPFRVKVHELVGGMIAITVFIYLLVSA